MKSLKNLNDFWIWAADILFDLPLRSLSSTFSHKAVNFLRPLFLQGFVFIRYLHFSKPVMDFVLLQNFDNYLDAHIVKGRLEDQGIHCWLRDENLSAVIVDPILTNAISGGIKLMVPKDELSKALEILDQPQQELPDEI